MALLPSYFEDFLAEIRLTSSQKDELKEAHKTLRSRLEVEKTLEKIYVSTFLHGSYRRSTAIRPAKGKRVDVDIILVTKVDRFAYPKPADAMALLVPFLKRYYPGQYEQKGRSFGIELNEVDFDIVLTSAPSEVDVKALRSRSLLASDSLSEAPDWLLNEYWLSIEERQVIGSQSFLYKANQTAEWKTEPLWIPDREACEWQQTHPLEQLKKTRDKNKASSGHFINVVKALKWWRRCQHPDPERPKGYPLEHIIWHCCPDGISSVAEGVTLTLEEIAKRFSGYAVLGQTPCLLDHGVSQNVLTRLDGQDFADFHAQAAEAALLARKALDEENAADSARLWGKLLGDKFPPPLDETKGDGSAGGGIVGGFSGGHGPAIPGSGRFG